MVQNQDKRFHFEKGKAPAETQLQVLCDDSRSTYVLPFNCFFRKGKWIGVGAGKPIEENVIGWRLASPPALKRTDS